ncbi:MAG: hypothetical protein ABIQ16_00135 [Polyangiaceae bacterium]
MIATLAETLATGTTCHSAYKQKLMNGLKENGHPAERIDRHTLHE